MKTATLEKTGEIKMITILERKKPMISRRELEELLRLKEKMGLKCCNRIYVEKTLEEDTNSRLPVLINVFCRHCTGYNRISECKGRGYMNPNMKEAEKIRDITYY